MSTSDFYSTSEGPKEWELGDTSNWRSELMYLTYHTGPGIASFVLLILYFPKITYFLTNTARKGDIFCIISHLARKIRVI